MLKIVGELNEEEVRISKISEQPIIIPHELR